MSDKIGFEVISTPTQRYDVVDGGDVAEGLALLVTWPDGQQERRHARVEFENTTEEGRDEYSPDIVREDIRSYFLFQHHGSHFRVYLREIIHSGAKVSRPPVDCAAPFID